MSREMFLIDPNDHAISLTGQNRMHYDAMIARFDSLAARGYLEKLGHKEYRLTDAGAAALAAMDRPRSRDTY